jgi:hypothetical protein
LYIDGNSCDCKFNRFLDLLNMSAAKNLTKRQKPNLRSNELSYRVQLSSLLPFLLSKTIPCISVLICNERRCKFDIMKSKKPFYAVCNFTYSNYNPTHSNFFINPSPIATLWPAYYKFNILVNLSG